MVKKVIKRSVPFLAACFLFLCSFCFLPSIPASANVGNGAVYPTYFALLPFENVICHNSGTGYNYYLDWAYNSFARKGYNYSPNYSIGTNFFQYSGTPYFYSTSVINPLFNAAVDCSIITNVDWSGYNGYLDFTAFEMYVPTSVFNGALDDNAFAYFIFGDGQYDYTVEISFDVNYVSYSYDQKYQLRTISFFDSFSSMSCYPYDRLIDHLNAGDSFRSVNILRRMAEMLVAFDPDDMAGSRFFLSNVTVRFLGLNQNASSPFGSTISYVASVGRDGFTDPLDSFSTWFDNNFLPVQTEEVIIQTDFPKDWTSWIANAAEGFFDMQIAPNLSLGMVFAAVFGVLILWFLIHLFM